MSFFITSFALVQAQHDGHNTTGNTNEQKRSQQKKIRRIGPVVEYHLYVNDTTVNYTGRKRKALAINGQIPAPTLRFTEGDSAVIHVHNLLNEEVSIHWHGVLLPNEQDGVHVLNTPPIHARQTYTFRYRIIQNGTLWYHSHSRVQEQEGLYGPLVFYPAEPENEKEKNEEVLQISDWRDERGTSILRSLKRRNEWYAIKKKGVQSWGEAIAKGHFNDKVQMEWTRMPGADLSDIYYQKHLMHGQPVNTFEKYKKGDSVLLRVINGSAASYYWLQYSGGKMRVIASDGNGVKPVEVDKLLIATAETYDIMIKIPDDGKYEFRATAQDITGYASAFFGSGTQVKAKDIPKLDYMVLMNEMNKMTWAMKGMGMKMKMGLYMKMGKMDMNNMGDMNAMDGMDHMNMQNEKVMNDMPMDDSKMDSAGMNMKKDSMQHDQMNMNDIMQHNMNDTMQHNMNDTMGMKDMDHSNMPGIEKKTTPKTNVKPPAKKPVQKKPAAKKAAPMKEMDHSKMKMPKKTPAKTPPAKKTTPAKKPPQKKAVDHSQHGTSHTEPPNDNKDSTLNMHLTASVPHATTGKMSRNDFRLNKNPISELSPAIVDTVPEKRKKEEMPMRGHEMHDMNNMKTDTTPKKKTQQKDVKGKMNMQHGNMNMGSMNGMQTRDTSRSFMLMNMMPRMKMTGFDFPPGNGTDVVLSYDMLQSDTMTVLPKDRPWREININLSGNMQRFVWSINGKTLSQQDEKILIRKGENVRVVFTNATMMEHPLHLHGHFFRVINKQGKYAPMKHTFNINAMATQVIEFAATEEKDWFFHCHTLYHMLSGMATIFSYEGTESQVQKDHPKEYKQFLMEHGSGYYPWANASFHSQGTFGTLVLAGARLQFDQDWKWNYKKSYELESRLQYFLDKRQFFSAFVGAEFSKTNVRNGKEQPDMEQAKIATAGLIYTLPFLINAEGRIDHKGNFRFQLLREDIPLTTRTRLDLYWNTEKEYGVTARYIVAKYLTISGNYDSDYGWGAGLSLIY